MILQALTQAYERFVTEEVKEVPPYGYSLVPVRFAILLDKDGSFHGLLDLRDGGRDRELQVPAHKRRQSNILPYFLCDKPSYVLGIGAEDDISRFEAFKNFHKDLLGGNKNAECRAVLTFLKSWEPRSWLHHQCLVDAGEDLLQARNITFRLIETPGFIHDSPEMQQVWQDTIGQSFSDTLGQCLITGSRRPIARTHSVAIKGVFGAQPSGAALVSFNKDAFLSYGKQQSFNAPISESAAFAYATALNFLISNPKYNLRIGDSTVVFWAERSGKEENILLNLFGFQDTSESDLPASELDPQTRDQVQSLVARLRDGLPVQSEMLELDPNVTCYLLGLAPNNSRLSVRFWYVTSFGELFDRLMQHYKDLSIDGLASLSFPLWKLLLETAVLGKSKNISPLLSGQVMRSILTGQSYPYALYAAMLARARGSGDTNGVNPVRAAGIKAYLIRQARVQNNSVKEEMYTMSLNESTVEPAYLCGRLFALLEKAQQDAIPGASATIRDRYFGAASATPSTVFPQLLRLSRHHLAKAEYGDWLDGKIQNVMSGLERLPTNLSLEQQGVFILGYYHQRQALYKKKEKGE